MPHDLVVYSNISVGLSRENSKMIPLLKLIFMIHSINNVAVEPVLMATSVLDTTQRSPRNHTQTDTHLLHVKQVPLY